MNYPDVAVPETQHLTVNGAEDLLLRGVVLEKARRAYASKPSCPYTARVAPTLASSLIVLGFVLHRWLGRLVGGFYWSTSVSL